MDGHRVLLVDDEEDIRTVLTGVFERAGFDIVQAADGRTALQRLYEARPDLVVLDLGLPDRDGLEVLSRMREVSDVPVLVLTARAREGDKVVGLMSGADDYLTKPFSNSELVARCVALLRRAGAATTTSEVIDDGTVRLDLARREAWVDGRPVSLSRTEWNLLVAFVRRPNLVLSAEQLLEIAWNDPIGIGPGRVKFAVQRLRHRVGWTDPTTAPIHSVRQFGYRYTPRSAKAG